VRVAQARVLVAQGEAQAAVARAMQISRQAVYRTPKPRRSSQRRPVTDPVDVAIVETAKSYPTDGYRMICCFVGRSLGVAVNRKRVLRVMREQKLIQRRPVETRRRRPGVFKVERPGQLWHLDMTSVWVAEHGWVYLNAIIDCCTREIVGWSLELRCRAAEAITVVKRAVDEQAILPGTLTLGTDNRSAFTARSTRLAISALGVTHRRGAYRDPESQAFIESWFRYLKERCVWRNEFETLDQAREVIAAPHGPLPRPAPLTARLQDTARSARNVGRCTGSAKESRGLNRQRGTGAVVQETPDTDSRTPGDHKAPRQRMTTAFAFSSRR
jgi:putative transposase